MIIKLTKDPKTFARFKDVALSIIKEAEDRELVLRLIGALAMNVHSPKYSYLFDSMDRKITDIDFMAYGKQISQVVKLMKDLGYN